MNSLYYKLEKAWTIIRWLDKARWSKGASSSLIPGPIFDSLDACDQILTHWLCYITDQQRPWQDVWQQGGPIFAEIVKHYKRTSNADELLSILREFSEPSEPGKVDALVSKQRTTYGKRITFTPRYGVHILSIFRTLSTLLNYQNNIFKYLSHNSPFILRYTKTEDDTPTLRMVFLLYILSYERIYKGITSFHKQKDEIEEDLRRRQCDLENLFKTEEGLESAYFDWIKLRFLKRLWAGFRDYVKPGSYFEPLFLNALKDIKEEAILSYFLHNRKEMLCSLELPGDTWNLKFNQKLFNKNINNPSELRQYYKRLRAEGRLSDEFYPEQFDVSFDFTPRMCGLGNEFLCPFKNSLKLYGYCFGDVGEGKLCPVSKIIAGYESDCFPQECPIKSKEIEDICSGCGWNIE